MGIFGGLFGSPTPATNESGPSDHTTSADLFNSTTFASNVQPQSTNQSTSGLPLPPLSNPAPAPVAPTAADMFSTSAYDPAKLHPLAGLDKMDFLALDEDKLSDVQGAATVLPSRGWTDDLCIGTGTTYLSGKLNLPGFFDRKLISRTSIRRSLGLQGGFLETTRKQHELQTAFKQCSQRMYKAGDFRR